MSGAHGTEERKRHPRAPLRLTQLTGPFTADGHGWDAVFYVSPLRDVWRRAQRRVRVIPAFWQKLSNDWVFNLAALLAYNLLLSAFPLLLVLVFTAGFVLGAISPGQTANMNATLTHLVPGAAGVLQRVQSELSATAGPLFAVALIGALFTGSRIFVTLESCFNIVFRLRPRGFVAENKMALGMLLLYVLLIPFVLLASLAPSAVFAWLAIDTAAPLIAFAIQAGGVVLAVVIACVLFGAIYLVVPNQRVRLRDVVPGTLVAALLLLVYESIFPIYTHLLLKPSSYGSAVGLALVILVFFYYLALILLIGAEVNSWIAGYRAFPCDIPGTMHEVELSTRAVEHERVMRNSRPLRRGFTWPRLAAWCAPADDEAAEDEAADDAVDALRDDAARDSQPRTRRDVGAPTP